MLLMNEFLTTKRFEATYLGVEFPGRRGDGLIEQTRQFMRMANPPCIIADSVAEHLFADTEQERWNARDFACLVPPHPVFWIECCRPSCIRSEVRDLVDPRLLPRRWGGMFSGGSKSTPTNMAIARSFVGADPSFAASAARPGWLMVANLVLELDSGALVVVPMVRVSSINEQGVEEEARWLGAGPHRPTADDEHLMRTLVSLFYPHLLTIRLLNEGRVDVVRSTMSSGAPLFTLGRIRSQPAAI